LLGGTILTGTEQYYYWSYDYYCFW